VQTKKAGLSEDKPAFSFKIRYIIFYRKGHNAYTKDTMKTAIRVLCGSLCKTKFLYRIYFVIDDVHFSSFQTGCPGCRRSRAGCVRTLGRGNEKENYGQFKSYNTVTPLSSNVLISGHESDVNGFPVPLPTGGGRSYRETLSPLPIPSLSTRGFISLIWLS